VDSGGFPAEAEIFFQNGVHIIDEERDVNVTDIAWSNIFMFFTILLPRDNSANSILLTPAIFRTGKLDSSACRLASDFPGHFPV